MRTFTIELDVRGRDALVVGGRGEAASKIERLVLAGARLTVIAEGDVDAWVEEAAREGRVELLRRAARESDAEGRAIVFLEPGGAGDEDLSRRLFERAKVSGALVCTLDRPEVSTFINPAVVHVSGLTLTVSTGGVSPAMARRIREDLEALFSEARFARFLSKLGELRAGLPRGERGARIKEAVKGFAIEARLRFPGWFERGEEP
jgi:precorrin-2 dehydrogenase / sirohydrochlorin ferrochelatase